MKISAWNRNGNGNIGEVSYRLPHKIFDHDNQTEIRFRPWTFRIWVRLLAKHCLLFTNNNKNTISIKNMSRLELTHQNVVWCFKCRFRCNYLRIPNILPEKAKLVATLNSTQQTWLSLLCSREVFLSAGWNSCYAQINFKNTIFT